MHRKSRSMVKKTKRGARIKINGLSKALAQIAVAAVEQTMKDSNIEEKKAAAEKKLSELTRGALSPEEIDHLIEDAVFALSQQIGHSIKEVQAVPELEKTPIGFAPKAST